MLGEQKPMAVNRRSFLKSVGGGAVASCGVWSGRAARAADGPSEKLNVAFVGAGGQAGFSIDGLRSQNIAALCDVDAGQLAGAAKNFPRAKQYRDYRKMLDAEAKRIDAVVVATPDHIHAPATAMALRMGKHVYCEKPLTHTVQEARTVAELAAKHKCVTQMGTQIHAGGNYRRVVELIRAGAIGQVREVHVWVGTQWSDGRFDFGSPAPATLDWDLWLGPAKQRPYSKGVHPFHWRRFWDFGTGSLGDMACHFVDLVFWALDLRHPTRVWAEGPAVHEVGAPAWCIAHWEFPPREKLPGLTLHWYDGGKRPELLGKLKRRDGSPVRWDNGQLFVGDAGMLLANYGDHLLLPEEKFADFKRPPKSIPDSIGHHREWVEACKQGGTTTCNFDYAGALTETVLLGTVAYRVGEKLEWDAKALKATNCPAAERFLRKEYRKGWEV